MTLQKLGGSFDLIVLEMMPRGTKANFSMLWECPDENSLSSRSKLITHTIPMKTKIKNLQFHRTIAQFFNAIIICM